MLRLDERHALLARLRRPGRETQLTQALAAFCEADPRFAAGFVRIILECVRDGELVPRAADAYSCRTEEVVADGRLDLAFDASDWRLIVELKLDADFSDGQVSKYLATLPVDVENAFVVALTRDIPRNLDDDLDPKRWLGVVRWHHIARRLRDLTPQNSELARQWPLFLDVLAVEGAVTEQTAVPELFRAWALTMQANQHLVNFLANLRPAVQEGIEKAFSSCGPPNDCRVTPVTTPRWVKGVADFARRYGTIELWFGVPPAGAGRINVGFYGDRGELWAHIHATPLGPAAPGREKDLESVIDSLLRGGFEFRDRHRLLAATLPISDAMLTARDLDEQVLAWWCDRSRVLAKSRLHEMIAPLEAEAPPTDDSLVPLPAGDPEINADSLG
jgi:hypothetical protein